jgi:hypothetical protein
LNTIFSLFDRRQVLVVFSEELRTKLEKTLTTVRLFIGLKKYKYTTVDFKKQYEIDKEEKKIIDGFYAPFNRRFLDFCRRNDIDFNAPINFKWAY